MQQSVAGMQLNVSLIHKIVVGMRHGVSATSGNVTRRPGDVRGRARDVRKGPGEVRERSGDVTERPRDVTECFWGRHSACHGRHRAFWGRHKAFRACHRACRGRHRAFQKSPRGLKITIFIIFTNRNRYNREILRMLRKPWFLSIGQRFRAPWERPAGVQERPGSVLERARTFQESRERPGAF